MVALLDSILDVADAFDAIVLDQWGVLHDGSAPYPQAQAALTALQGRRLAVLSNSGKRAAPNAQRIASMGFDGALFETVMTSGEALWRMFAQATDAPRRLFPIEGKHGDAQAWADRLEVEISQDIKGSDAVVLMGLPDGTLADGYDAVLNRALELKLPLYCSNPDLTSPRGGQTFVMSPGVLAQRYQQAGGVVHLFGKPHLPIYAALQSVLGCPPGRILMVGDSLHHDIAGAHTAGWKSLLIESGVHSPHIGADRANDITQLSAQAHTLPPHYSLTDLR